MATEPVALEAHLFRREAGRMTAALTRLFGVHNMALAEDVVQDAFCRALEVWKFRGIPPNPSAWLMATARHRALDVIRRERTARTFAPELTRLLETEWATVAVVDEAFTDHVVLGERLRMMFACCDPRLSEPAQIALILNILCGFGAGEIAAAFLEGRAAVEKRITRGRKVLAESATLFDLSDADSGARLAAVHRALYLLFNEGYHGSSTQQAIRAELCGEAMRLAALLRKRTVTRTPETLVLGALMALHAARLPARVDAERELQPFGDQDRASWDRDLIAEGRALLDASASGEHMSSYHLEAAIAAVHAASPSAADTDWGAIVWLYDQLMRIEPSAVVALNRAIAIGQREGADRGIHEIERIADLERLSAYPFLPAALGELERRRGNDFIAAEHFARAVELARNEAERSYLRRRAVAGR